MAVYNIHGGHNPQVRLPVEQVTYQTRVEKIENLQRGCKVIEEKGT